MVARMPKKKGKETKKLSIEDRDSVQTISLTQKQYYR